MGPEQTGSGLMGPGQMGPRKKKSSRTNASYLSWKPFCPETEFSCDPFVV